MIPKYELDREQLAQYSISLDLDGVMADYAAGMVALGYSVDPKLGRELNRSGTSHPLKREMYEKIKGTQFYRNLPLMAGATKLYAACAAADPIIVTAAPKFGADEEDYLHNVYWQGAAYHKRAWVEQTLLPCVFNQGYKFEFDRKLTDFWDAHTALRIPIPDDRFVCTTSSRKWQYMHRKHSTHQILIDDRIANIEAWAEAGGIGIFHLDADTSINALASIAYGEPWSEPGSYGSNGGSLFDPRV